MTHRILAALALIALTGCAALPAPSPQALRADDIDLARMAAIERAAALHGVKVVWVHAPRRNAVGG